MKKDIIMPRFDPEMKEGTVVEWLKKEGERVTKGEPVVRIDTEKVSLDVESPETGVLSKILVNPPNMVPIGTPIGSILTDSETSGTSAPQPSEPRTTKQEAQREGEPKVSPSARRAARELGVDLSYVKGTGPMGRITSEDVEKFASSSKTVQEARPMPKTAAAEEPKKFRAVKPSVMRTRVGERMTESWTTIPQVPLFALVDLTEAERFRTAMESMLGKKVTLTAIVTKALANSLESFRDLNSRFEEGEIREFEDVDIAIAVALEQQEGGGLIAPVVRRASRKTATDIAAEIEDLAERARSGKLNPSEVRGGTTTVSNLAGYGVDSFIPIINPPQATILGVGRIISSPNPSCTITLVFDHRVTDGARAARLLQKIREYIESPYLLQMG